MNPDGTMPAPPRVWRTPEGGPVSCTEKVMVLEENWREAAEALQTALDDAVLMGCSEAFARAELERLVREIRTPYAEAGKTKAAS